MRGTRLNSAPTLKQYYSKCKKLPGSSERIGATGSFFCLEIVVSSLAEVVVSWLAEVAVSWLVEVIVSWLVEVVVSWLVEVAVSWMAEVAVSCLAEVAPSGLRKILPCWTPFGHFSLPPTSRFKLFLS